MTLATDIYITGIGVTMREVYDQVNDLLEIPADRLFTETPTSIRNRIGQGFPAIVDVTAAADGGFVTPEHEDYCAEEAEESGEPCGYHRHTEPHHVHVDLDTAYSYSDDRGWDCSRLHAYVILSLAGWLSDKGCTVRWTNEYAGTVHDATDREAFERFIGSGDAAAEWFVGSVLPAIAAMGPPSGEVP